MHALDALGNPVRRDDPVTRCGPLRSQSESLRRGSPSAAPRSRATCACSRMPGSSSTARRAPAASTRCGSRGSRPCGTSSTSSGTRRSRNSRSSRRNDREIGLPRVRARAGIRTVHRAGVGLVARGRAAHGRPAQRDQDARGRPVLGARDRRSRGRARSGDRLGAGARAGSRLLPRYRRAAPDRGRRAVRRGERRDARRRRSTARSPRAPSCGPRARRASNAPGRSCCPRSSSAAEIGNVHVTLRVVTLGAASKRTSEERT